MKQMVNTITKGVAGTTSSLIGVATINIQSIELSLRIFGSVIAITVGTATLVSVAFDIRRKWRDRNK